MNLLEHYILEVKEINVLPAHACIKDEFLEVKVFCDCWGDKRIVKHVTTRADWERELRQGYFLA